MAEFWDFGCQFLVIGEAGGVVAGEVGMGCWSDNGDSATTIQPLVLRKENLITLTEPSGISIVYREAGTRQEGPCL